MSSWPLSGPTLAILSLWGTDQQMKALSSSFSLFSLKLLSKIIIFKRLYIKIL